MISIKNSVTFSIVLTLLAIFSVSCKKSSDPVNPYDIPVNFYLAVNDTGRIAVFKDDSQIFTYSEEKSYVSDMTMAGGKLELCGHVVENSLKRPALWIDGQLSKPLKDSVGTVSAIFRDGNDRYCLATIQGETDVFGVLLKNGQIVYFSEEGVAFDKFGMGQSGDIYIAGRVRDANTGLFRKAYLWRVKYSDFSLAQSPIQIMLSDKEIRINALQVGLYSIAAAIEKQETDKATSAWGWLYDNRIAGEGECVMLSSANSKSSSVMFANGYWLVGGARPNGDSYDATIWQNGSYVIPMENQCNPGGSNVALLYFGGYNTYECVHSPGQVQLCRNGALRLMISCAATVVPAAWLVVKQ